MSQPKKLDFWDILVFDRDEEANQAEEQVAEDVPLTDLIADSDDELQHGNNNAANKPMDQDQEQEEFSTGSGMKTGRCEK